MKIIANIAIGANNSSVGYFKMVDELIHHKPIQHRAKNLYLQA
jgi:hypothetical protein